MTWNDFLSALMALILAVLASFGITGCITTKAPDGTETTAMDMQSAIAFLQAALPIAEEAYNTWIAARSKMQDAEFQAGLRTREQNLNLIRDALTQLLAKQAAKVAAQ